MTDPIIAYASVARFALLKAKFQCPEGEAHERFGTALAALQDAIEQRTEDVRSEEFKGHLDLLAKAVETPSIREDDGR